MKENLKKRAEALGVKTTDVKVPKEVELAILQRLLSEIEVGIVELRTRVRLKMFIGGNPQDVTILLNSVEKTLLARDELVREIADLGKR